MSRFFRGLRGDSRGVTIIEFAIVAPVMVLMITGLSDLKYRLYAQSILEGAMQKAARDSAIEGGALRSAELDGKVMSMVKKVAPSATYVSSRKNYDTFSSVAPEKFTDTNNNGVREAGECYDDVNANQQWDADPGISGQGGADDVVVYEMTVNFPRIFPLAGAMGWSSVQEIKAKTLLKNQPFASQNIAMVVSRCT